MAADAPTTQPENSNSAAPVVDAAPAFGVAFMELFHEIKGNFETASVMAIFPAVWMSAMNDANNSNLRDFVSYAGDNAQDYKASIWESIFGATDDQTLQAAINNLSLQLGGNSSFVMYQTEKEKEKERASKRMTDLGDAAMADSTTQFVNDLKQFMESDATKLALMEMFYNIRNASTPEAKLAILEGARAEMLENFIAAQKENDPDFEMSPEWEQMFADGWMKTAKSLLGASFAGGEGGKEFIQFLEDNPNALEETMQRMILASKDNPDMIQKLATLSERQAEIESITKDVENLRTAIAKFEAGIEDLIIDSAFEDTAPEDKFATLEIMQASLAERLEAAEAYGQDLYTQGERLMAGNAGFDDIASFLMLEGEQMQHDVAAQNALLNPVDQLAADIANGFPEQEAFNMVEYAKNAGDASGNDELNAPALKPVPEVDKAAVISKILAENPYGISEAGLQDKLVAAGVPEADIADVKADFQVAGGNMSPLLETLVVKNGVRVGGLAGLEKTEKSMSDMFGQKAQVEVVADTPKPADPVMVAEVAPKDPDSTLQNNTMGA